MIQEFSYKGFEITVITKSMWVRGVTTSWDKQRKRSTFHGYNPVAEKFIQGVGGKRKAKALVDSLEQPVVA